MPQKHQIHWVHQVLQPPPHRQELQVPLQPSRHAMSKLTNVSPKGKKILKFLLPRSCFTGNSERHFSFQLQPQHVPPYPVLLVQEDGCEDETQVAQRAESSWVSSPQQALASSCVPKLFSLFPTDETMMRKRQERTIPVQYLFLQKKHKLREKTSNITQPTHLPAQQ